MTIPTIPSLAHEILITHLDEAIAKFVNGEIYYIIGISVVVGKSVVVFQIQRQASNLSRYTTVLHGKTTQGPTGDVEYDDVKTTLLGFIDAFEAIHGFRSHERPDQMFVYRGGVTTQEVTVEFVFPNADEMQSKAKKNYDALVAAEAAEDKRRQEVFEQAVNLLWEKTLQKVAALIRKAADAGESRVDVYDTNEHIWSDHDDDGAVGVVFQRLRQFLRARGYTVAEDNTNSGHLLVVTLIGS
jgi:hypothetical protein